MNINWKLKSKIFTFIDFFNFHAFLYFVQKNITKRSRLSIDLADEDWMFHEQNLLKKKNSKILEFGAGKDLRQNIYLSQFCSEQIVVDLFPMLDLNQFNEASKQISRFTDLNYIECKSIDEMSKNYNIKYLAPVDMVSHPFADNYFDGCISTNTLEHIPKEEVINIFKGLKRTIKPGGFISIKIDYSDHYSHTDKKIGSLNFLKFSESDWIKYNHPSHFQNRLRHDDFIRIFEDIGYFVKKEEGLNSESLPSGCSVEFNGDRKMSSYTSGLFLLTVSN